jgi:DNA-directed RNA polymerase subunit RPC12/RpoP
MGKCSACGKEIDHLIYYSKVEATQTFNGEDYSAIDDLGEHTDDEYHCPECDGLLTKDEEIAKQILGVVG